MARAVTVACHVDTVYETGQIVYSLRTQLERPGDDDVLEKVFGDLQAKGVDSSEHIVRKHMDELLTEAMQQVHDGV